MKTAKERIKEQMLAQGKAANRWQKMEDEARLNIMRHKLKINKK